MKRMVAVLDLQFGSTGKGNVVGFLAQEEEPDTIMTAWAPNAGHTSIVGDVAMINTQLANGIQSPRMKRLLIGPGSVLNLPELLRELCTAFAKGIKPFDIIVHPQAAVLLPGDAEAEAGHLFKIGSTMKGSSAALMRKLRRTGKHGTIRQAALTDPEVMEQWARISLMVENMDHSATISKSAYMSAIEVANVVLIEGCQGYSLGVNSGFYPYCTSRECTLAQAMVDLAIPFGAYIHSTPRIVGVARTYPIRVANRFDKDGEQIGTSGPCYADQRELTWEGIGQKPELTTVTKLPRRVFSFSVTQVEDAMHASGVTEVFVTFADYVSDSLLLEIVKSINDAAGKTIVTHCAWGPRSDRDIRPMPYLTVDA